MTTDTQEEAKIDQAGVIKDRVSLYCLLRTNPAMNRCQSLAAAPPFCHAEIVFQNSPAPLKLQVSGSWQSNTGRRQNRGAARARRMFGVPRQQNGLRTWGAPIILTCCNCGRMPLHRPRLNKGTTQRNVPRAHRNFSEVCLETEANRAVLG